MFLLLFISGLRFAISIFLLIRLVILVVLSIGIIVCLGVLRLIFLVFWSLGLCWCLSLRLEQKGRLDFYSH